MNARTRFSRPLRAAGFAITLALAAWPSAAGETAGGADPRYRLVVNRANPLQELPRAHVSRIFLKNGTRWPNGAVAEPLDLAGPSPARRDFSLHVHQKAVRAVKAYWRRQIFSGRGAPPPEIATEDEVLAAVRANPRAVGYVSDEVMLTGVKILDVIEEPAGS